MGNSIVEAMDAATANARKAPAASQTGKAPAAPKAGPEKKAKKVKKPATKAAEKKKNMPPPSKVSTETAEKGERVVRGLRTTNRLAWIFSPVMLAAAFVLMIALWVRPETGDDPTILSLVKFIYRFNFPLTLLLGITHGYIFKGQETDMGLHYPDISEEGFFTYTFIDVLVIHILAAMYLHTLTSPKAALIPLAISLGLLFVGLPIGVILYKCLLSWLCRRGGSYQMLNFWWSHVYGKTKRGF